MANDELSNEIFRSLKLVLCYLNTVTLYFLEWAVHKLLCTFVPTTPNSTASADLGLDSLSCPLIQHLCYFSTKKATSDSEWRFVSGVIVGLWWRKAYLKEWSISPYVSATVSAKSKEAARRQRWKLRGSASSGCLSAPTCGNTRVIGSTFYPNSSSMCESIYPKGSQRCKLKLVCVGDWLSFRSKLLLYLRLF